MVSQELTGAYTLNIFSLADTRKGASSIKRPGAFNGLFYECGWVCPLWCRPRLTCLCRVRAQRAEHPQERLLVRLAGVPHRLRPEHTLEVVPDPQQIQRLLREGRARREGNKSEKQEEKGKKPEGDRGGKDGSST